MRRAGMRCVDHKAWLVGIPEDRLFYYPYANLQDNSISKAFDLILKTKQLLRSVCTLPDVGSCYFTKHRAGDLVYIQWIGKSHRRVFNVIINSNFLRIAVSQKDWIQIWKSFHYIKTTFLRTHTLTSVFISADISVWSPRMLVILIQKKSIFRIKVYRSIILLYNEFTDSHHSYLSLVLWL